VRSLSSSNTGSGEGLNNRINLIYTDVAVDFERNFTRSSVYADRVKDSVVEALEEEAILIAVLKVYDCE
jgi:hypothetical protein